uniref:Uncharacterized protein n=1 Tax=Myoviridae sp. ct4QN2 TaxID=2825030 RepID=A0A8S5PWP3_9CAUD|nr:MAG TPA: hypothetical protein [Myoviridae sp. ct4QN2]
MDLKLKILKNTYFYGRCFFILKSVYLIEIFGKICKNCMI